MTTQAQERRTEGQGRKAVETLVEVVGNEPGIPAFEAESVDVSARGMHLRTAYLPDEGAPLVCRFEEHGREIVVEGVVVGAGAVIAPNIVLSASIPVIDVTGPEPVEHRGYVPPGAVVLPGTRPKEYPAGRYDLPCALIVGRRSASTDLKTSLNDVLREFEIAT